MVRTARGENSRFTRLMWALLALGMLVGALIAPPLNDRILPSDTASALEP